MTSSPDCAAPSEKPCIVPNKGTCRVQQDVLRFTEEETYQRTTKEDSMQAQYVAESSRPRDHIAIMLRSGLLSVCKWLESI